MNSTGPRLVIFTAIAMNGAATKTNGDTTSSTSRSSARLNALAPAESTGSKGFVCRDERVVVDGAASLIAAPLQVANKRRQRARESGTTSSITPYKEQSTRSSSTTGIAVST